MKVCYCCVFLLFWSSVANVQSFQVKYNHWNKRVLVLRNTNEKTNEGEFSGSKRVCIIGSGWAGFSAADALSRCKVVGGDEGDMKPLEIHLLDASPRGPGGLAAGWKSRRLNRTVEAGLHGFWREYKNTYAAIEGAGLEIDDVLTDYTPSVLVSESGRVALAPVLGEEANRKHLPLDLRGSVSLLSTLANLLPPPLDIALLSEFDGKSPLTVADRMSALGLLGVWSDFDQNDKKSWLRYDSISADTLFRSIGGVSNRAYRELVAPLLHVLPMTPGYDCSAAAALSCFHTFALQSKGAFDVRWCKGSISELIFNPWAAKLQGTGSILIDGSSKVTSIEEICSKGKKEFKVEINEEKTLEFDYIIFAVGANSFKRLLPKCSFLSKHPDADNWRSLRGITCVAVRLFLRPQTSDNGAVSGIRAIDEAMDEAVFVCGPNVGGIPELVETGFCIYDLQRLQNEYSLLTQRNEETIPCVAYEIDFFRANCLVDMGNDAVATLALKALCAALEIPPIEIGSILDVSVIRANDAVSHFCVRSALCSPPVKLLDGVFMCGDWIDRTGHGSWSTEKAVVTGRQAAASLAKDIGLDCDAEVIPVASETPQLGALRRIARAFIPPGTIPPAPWALWNQLAP
ncbi:unnamed protein product [Cylindrotheca closterium]|uniref:Amine oxidase domain-containing protein n=1 Tax=Cylindrotheca closterium TaxID=2856 RepID=A0AAD2FZ30_9STRA|nr:unnamed protein product [Cylindrotheca closterium]